MPEYLCNFAPPGGWDVVDGSGHLVTVYVSQTTTLRADYVTSLAAYFSLVSGGGDEVPLTVRDATGLDLDDPANWTAAVADGFYFANTGDIEVRVVNLGPQSALTVRIEGTPDLVLGPLDPGDETETDGTLSVARFSSTAVIHFDADPTGLELVAIRKGAVV